MAQLEGTSITKHFGGLAALSQVDFAVNQGEIVGLIGPNGAGKTTLFNVITGFLKPSSGRVFFDGQEITALSRDRICHLGISRTYQTVRPFAGLSVLENVKAGIFFGRREASPRPRQADEEARELLAFMGLSEKEAYLASSLPTGERKRLEIARALATNPKVLLLDEVVAGLTAPETAAIMELLKRIRQQGITIFIIEHVMKAIMGLSDRVMVLHHGEKIAEGRPEEVAKDTRVIDAYLGEALV